jgi:hypothetical protein
MRYHFNDMELYDNEIEKFDSGLIGNFFWLQFFDQLKQKWVTVVKYNSADITFDGTFLKTGKYRVVHYDHYNGSDYNTDLIQDELWNQISNEFNIRIIESKDFKIVDFLLTSFAMRNESNNFVLNSVVKKGQWISIKLDPIWNDGLFHLAPEVNLLKVTVMPNTANEDIFDEIQEDYGDLTIRFKLKKDISRTIQSRINIRLEIEGFKSLEQNLHINFKD